MAILRLIPLREQKVDFSTLEMAEVGIPENKQLQTGWGMST